MSSDKLRRSKGSNTRTRKASAKERQSMCSFLLLDYSMASCRCYPPRAFDKPRIFFDCEVTPQLHSLRNRDQVDVTTSAVCWQLMCFNLQQRSLTSLQKLLLGHAASRHEHTGRREQSAYNCHIHNKANCKNSHCSLQSISIHSAAATHARRPTVITTHIRRFFTTSSCSCLFAVLHPKSFHTQNVKRRWMSSK